MPDLRGLLRGKAYALFRSSSGYQGRDIREKRKKTLIIETCRLFEFFNLIFLGCNLG